MDSIQYDDKNKFASLQCVWSKFLSFGSSFSSRRNLLLHTQTNKTENQNKASCICSVRWPSYRWVRLLSRANLFISSVIKKNSLAHAYMRMRVCMFLCQVAPWYRPPSQTNVSLNLDFHLLDEWKKIDFVIWKQRESKLSLKKEMYKMACVSFCANHLWI